MSTLRTIAGLASLGLFALLAGCGGGSSAVDVDEAFRRIQVYEATIAHRAAEAEACPPDEDCPPELALCEAVEGLCETSRSIDDPDAARRCQAARRRCPEAP